MKFSITFSNKLTCEYEAPEVFPEGGWKPVLIWSSDVTARTMDQIKIEYLNWQYTNYQIMADIWQKRVGMAFGGKAYLFRPDGPMKIMPLAK